MWHIKKKVTKQTKQAKTNSKIQTTEWWEGGGEGSNIGNKRTLDFGEHAIE